MFDQSQGRNFPVGHPFDIGFPGASPSIWTSTAKTLGSQVGIYFLTVDDTLPNLGDPTVPRHAWCVRAPGGPVSY